MSDPRPTHTHMPLHRRDPSPLLRRLLTALTLVLLTLGGTVGAQAWPLPELDALVAMVDASPSVRQAALAMEDARLALDAAGALVSGSLRGSGSLGWSDSQGWEASLGAITLSTQWQLFAAGPSHQAYLRAEQALTDAEEAWAEARRTAASQALSQVWALQRLNTETAIAEARLDLAERKEEAVRTQFLAGAVHASALEEARLASLQAELDLNELRLDVAEAELAFQQAFGVAAGTLSNVDAGVLAELLSIAEAASLPPFASIEAAELDGAVRSSSAVRNAAVALEQARQGLSDVRQASSPSTSLSAGFSTSGQSGQFSVSSGWDSSSMQPSLSLSVDPWSTQAARTAAQLSVSVTIPLDPYVGIDLAREELAIAAAEAALLQAEQTAALDIEGRWRSLLAGEAGLDLARARLDLRQTSLDSLRTRADHGSVSPLDLLTGELDAAEAALSLLRAMDQVAFQQAALEDLLEREPSHPVLAAALATLHPDSSAPEAP